MPIKTAPWAPSSKLQTVPTATPPASVEFCTCTISNLFSWLTSADTTKVVTARERERGEERKREVEWIRIQQQHQPKGRTPCRLLCLFNELHFKSSSYNFNGLSWLLLRRTFCAFRHWLLPIAMRLIAILPYILITALISCICTEHLAKFANQFNKKPIGVYFIEGRMLARILDQRVIRSLTCLIIM